MRRVAMTCGAVADADLGVVFGISDVAHPVQAVLDRPVTAQPASDRGGCGVGDR